MSHSSDFMLRRWRHAVAQGEEAEAYAAADDLVAFLDRGGRPPRGMTERDERAIRFDADAGGEGAEFGAWRGAQKFVVHEDMSRRAGWWKRDEEEITASERTLQKKIRAYVMNAMQTHRASRGTILASRPGWNPWSVDYVEASELGMARGDRSATELVAVRCTECNAHSPRFAVPFGADWKKRVPPEVIGWMNKHGAMRHHTVLPGHTVGFEFDPREIDKPWVRDAVAKAKQRTARKKAVQSALVKSRSKK